MHAVLNTTNIGLVIMFIWNSESIKERIGLKTSLIFMSVNIFFCVGVTQTFHIFPQLIRYWIQMKLWVDNFRNSSVVFYPWDTYRNIANHTCNLSCVSSNGKIKLFEIFLKISHNSIQSCKKKKVDFPKYLKCSIKKNFKNDIQFSASQGNGILIL